MIFLTLLIVLVTIILYLYYTTDYKARRLYNHFKCQGIPFQSFESPAWALIKSLIAWGKSSASNNEVLGDQTTFGSTLLMNNGLLMINEPDYLVDVLKKYGTYYNKTDFSRAMLEPIIGIEGLVLSNGMQHKNARKCLNPAFHSIKIKEMLEQMNDITEESIDKWLSAESKKRISMHQELSVLVTKILMQVLFDNDHRRSDSEMIKVIGLFEKAINIIYYRVSYLSFAFLWLCNWPICQKSVVDKCNKDLLAFIEQIIFGRQTNKTNKDDLLNLLLSPKNGFTDKQIREQILSFVVAGHDTVATLLSWAIFILMTKPTIYEACRNEVDTVLIGKKPDYDQLNKLKIINAVIYETLRMYVPIPLIMRECVQEHFIGPHDRKQIHMPRGAIIGCYIPTIHHSSKYWRDPEEFDYTRWMEDENGNPPKLAHPCCFLPFAAGNRNCIGQTYAIQEAITILAMMIQRLNFEIVPEQEIVCGTMVTQKPKYDILVDISKRSN
ncbi:unnamed protein product [Adineta steineri]|uniref:Cytochrome P450 n=1 Tax=Adineta steineri TaxID=433720 RepID=A0A819TCS6_9BILA|nr:unnamed protein product [Adineta steineri]CAF4063800.1 unnamed protein product [Adineta steineri]